MAVWLEESAELSVRLQRKDYGDKYERKVSEAVRGVRGTLKEDVGPKNNVVLGI